MKTFWLAAIALIASAALPSSASAQWGDLKMKFVVDGKAPVMDPVDITKDKPICGKHKILSDEFVVGKDGGVKDVVVFLVPEEGKEVKVHSSYEADAKGTVTLDNKGCAFVPHIALLRVGQTFVIKNSDPTGHNSQFSFKDNKKSENPLIPPGGEYTVKAAEITKREVRPSPVSCAIHPWMTGQVIIQDHPYMAVSGEDGVVEIKNLPVGKHTFQLWQQQGYPAPGGLKQKVTKGKVEIEIKEGLNDLKELTMKPKPINK